MLTSNGASLPFWNLLTKDFCLSLGMISYPSVGPGLPRETTHKAKAPPVDNRPSQPNARIIHRNSIRQCRWSGSQPGLGKKLWGRLRQSYSRLLTGVTPEPMSINGSMLAVSLSVYTSQIKAVGFPLGHTFTGTPATAKERS